MRTHTIAQAVDALQNIAVQCPHCKAWASTGEFGGQGRVIHLHCTGYPATASLFCQCGMEVASVQTAEAEPYPRKLQWTVNG